MDKARQFIKDYTRGCSNELCAVEDIHGKKVISYHEWLTPEQALAAVDIAREELIDKGCEWLRTHSEADYFELIPVGNYCGAGNLNKKKMIEDFKKALGT